MLARRESPIRPVPDTPRILVVDDDPVVCDLIRETLSGQGYRVTDRGSGKDALAAFAGGRFDLVVLDRRLPDCDGLSVLRQIRESSDCPVIILTVMGGDQDRLLGLELGADDYINKPFNPNEVLLRAKRYMAIAGGRAALGGEVRFGTFELDTTSRNLTNTATGTTTRLSQAEAVLLEVFATHAGEVLDRDFLLNRVSHRDWSPYDRTIDVLTARLRRKIEADPRNPDWIITMHGEGYLFARRS